MNAKREVVSITRQTDLPESRLRKACLWALRADEHARAEDDGVVVAELGKSYFSQALAPGVQEVGLGVGAGRLGLSVGVGREVWSHARRGRRRAAHGPRRGLRGRR